MSDGENCSLDILDKIELQKKIEALEKRVAELEVKMNMVLPDL